MITYYKVDEGEAKTQELLMLKRHEVFYFDDYDYARDAASGDYIVHPHIGHIRKNHYISKCISKTSYEKKEEITYYRVFGIADTDELKVLENYRYFYFDKDGYARDPVNDSKIIYNDYMETFVIKYNDYIAERIIKVNVVSNTDLSLSDEPEKDKAMTAPELDGIHAVEGISKLILAYQEARKFNDFKYVMNIIMDMENQIGD